MKQRLLALGLLLWLSAIACMAAGDTATQADLTAAKELHQAKLDGFKELHQKDVDALRQQVAAVDKRVDDQLAQVGQAVDRFSAQSAWTGILITVLLIFGGFLGYRNAKQEAKADAKEAAEKIASDQGRTTAEQWFEQHNAALQKRIADLEQKATQVHHGMDMHLADIQNHATTNKEEMDRALATAQKSIHKPDQPPSPELERSQRLLSQRDQELKNTNEDSYSFDDWDTRAHAAYATKKLEDAAYFWHKAAGVPNAGAKNVAEALVNKGLTQGMLDQPEAELATYEELLRRFGDDTDPALREQLALALNNRGFTRFLQAKQLGLRSETAKNHLQAALVDFNQAVDHSAERNGLLLGNRAYVHQLLGNTQQAEHDFAVGMHAAEDGGQTLYDTTLKDLSLHPIPEDAAMRALVERAWSAYQQEQGGAPPPPPTA